MIKTILSLKKRAEHKRDVFGAGRLHHEDLDLIGCIYKVRVKGVVCLQKPRGDVVGKLGEHGNNKY